MIRVERLSKSFGSAWRECHAVRDVSFAAPDGQITGLLGPNGAGKTTLLRMLATLIVPDAGAPRSSAGSTSCAIAMPCAKASACCRMRAASIRG